MTPEKLQDEIDKIKAKRQQLIVQLHELAGAEKAFAYLLADLNKPQEKPDATSVPVASAQAVGNPVPAEGD